MKINDFFVRLNKIPRRSSFNRFEYKMNETICNTFSLRFLFPSRKSILYEYKELSILIPFFLCFLFHFFLNFNEKWTKILDEKNVIFFFGLVIFNRAAISKSARRIELCNRLVLFIIVVYLDCIFRVRPSRSTWPAAYCSITSFTSYLI